MIGYIVLGTNDLDKAAAFYDALLAEIGVGRMMDFGERGFGWAASMELGGVDEGAPGTRGEGGEGFYAAYFRDIDGNKLDVFTYHS